MSVISANDSEHYHWGTNCDGWHLVKNEALSVIQERMPPNSAEEAHFHQHAQQFFYILHGTATMEVNGVTQTLTSGQGMHVPAGVWHKMQNQHAEDLHFTVTSTPPSHGDRVV